MAESIPAPRSGVRAVAQGASPGADFTAQHPALRTFERIGIGRIPLLASPPRSASAAARSLKKGVAEQSRKCREASADSEAGVVFRMKTKRKTTPAASASVPSRYFLDDAATPPCGDARRGITRASVIPSHVLTRWAISLTSLRRFGSPFLILIAVSLH